MERWAEARRQAHGADGHVDGVALGVRRPRHVPGESETTALLTSHLADKLVLVLDDASLEEAIDLGAWAHGRRAMRAPRWQRVSMNSRA